MSAFLNQPWSNTRSTSNAIWENNLETFEKLFSVIQSDCSIYSYFLKPLHWNIHVLWHQALIAMKITVEDFQKIAKSLHFMHLTSINWLLLEMRLCFVTWCRALCENNLCKSDVQVSIYLKLLLIKSNPAVFLLIA